MGSVDGGEVGLGYGNYPSRGWLALRRCRAVTHLAGSLGTIREQCSVAAVGVASIRESSLSSLPGAAEAASPESMTTIRRFLVRASDIRLASKGTQMKLKL